MTIGIVIVVFLFLFFGLRIVKGYLPIDDNEPDEYTDAINYLKDVDYHISIYGDTINFRDGVDNVSYISNLKEESLSNNAKYSYLIINDMDGNVSIDKSDVKRLKEYADNTTNFSFVYYGLEHLDLFKSDLFDGYAQDDLDMSFGYVVDSGDSLITTGMLTTEDFKDIYKSDVNCLGEVVITSMVSTIKTNEQ